MINKTQELEIKQNTNELTEEGKCFFQTILNDTINTLKTGQQKLIYFEDFFGRCKSNFEHGFKTNLIHHFGKYASFGAIASNNYFSIFSEMKNIFKREKIKNLKLLFISDLSLCSVDTLSEINIILKCLKNNTKIFGGVSVFVFDDPLIKFNKKNHVIMQEFQVFNIKKFSSSEYNQELYKFSITGNLDYFSQRIKEQSFEEYLNENSFLFSDLQQENLDLKKFFSVKGVSFKENIHPLETIFICSTKKKAILINDNIMQKTDINIQTKKQKVLKKNPVTHLSKNAFPVVISKNSKQKKIFNGNRFFMERFPKKITLSNRFSRINFLEKSLKKIRFDVGWATTIHKSLLIKEFSRVYFFSDKLFNPKKQIYMLLSRINDTGLLVVSKSLNKYVKT